MARRERDVSAKIRVLQRAQRMDDRLSQSPAQPLGLGERLAFDVVARAEIAARAVVINRGHAGKRFRDLLAGEVREVRRHQLRVLVQHGRVRAIDQIEREEPAVALALEGQQADFGIERAVGIEPVAADALGDGTGDCEPRRHGGGVRGNASFDDATVELLQIFGISRRDQRIAAPGELIVGDRAGVRVAGADEDVARGNAGRLADRLAANDRRALRNEQDVQADQQQRRLAVGQIERGREQRIMHTR